MIHEDRLFVVETERLVLRPFLIGDAKCFYDLNNDPNVMKHTGDLSFQSVTSSADFIRRYDEYQKVGYGRWTVLRKSDMLPLGWCGLKYHLVEDYTDLGYRFMAKYWNQGYATEASIGCLEKAFDEIGLQEVVGRTAKENVASIRVLEKIGMKFWKEAPCEGIEHSVFYKITAKEWTRKT